LSGEECNAPLFTRKNAYEMKVDSWIYTIINEMRTITNEMRTITNEMRIMNL